MTETVICSSAAYVPSVRHDLTAYSQLKSAIVPKLLDTFHVPVTVLPFPYLIFIIAP